MKTRHKDGHRRVFVNEHLTASRGAPAYRSRTLDHGLLDSCWEGYGKKTKMDSVNITTDAELSAYGQV